MLAENLDIMQLFFILLYIVLEILVKGYFIKLYLKIILKIMKNSVYGGWFKFSLFDTLSILFSVGERKSPYIAVCCIAMAASILFWQWSSNLLLASISGINENVSRSKRIITFIYSKPGREQARQSLNENYGTCIWTVFFQHEICILQLCKIVVNSIIYQYIVFVSKSSGMSIFKFIH